MFNYKKFSKPIFCFSFFAERIVSYQRLKTCLQLLRCPKCFSGDSLAVSACGCLIVVKEFEANNWNSFFQRTWSLCQTQYCGIMVGWKKKQRIIGHFLMLLEPISNVLCHETKKFTVIWAILRCSKKKTHYWNISLTGFRSSENKN